MKKVTTFSLSRLNAAYHVNFMNNTAAIVEQYGEDSLGLTTKLFAKFKDDINAEQDAVSKSTASAETQKIKEQDALMNRYFRYVRNMLVNTQYGNTQELQDIYTRAKAAILCIYPGSIVNESWNEKSAHVRGFVLDVRNILKADLTKLGISDALNALEQALNKLQELYVTRTSNQAAYGTEVSSKCRAAVDEDYQQIVCRIEYTAQLTELTDESSVMIRQTCETFIETLNQLIARTWQSINQGKAQKKTGKTDDTDEPVRDDENEVDDTDLAPSPVDEAVTD